MKKNYRIDSVELTDLLKEDTEFLPLMSDEDEAKISKEDTPDILPILPLRNTVLFPGEADAAVIRIRPQNEFKSNFNQ